MDVLTPEQRHKNMSAIHGKDTKPEVWLRKKLFEQGYRYRKNVKNIPGHPDIWLAKYNTVIFIHGCFWHRHKDCKFASMPKSRTEFWMDKFNRNIERDNEVREELQVIGIKTLVVWECTIKRMMKDEKELLSVVGQIKEFLETGKGYKEM
jgi:DNA mismatch endonuclease (patch repair protein)